MFSKEAFRSKLAGLYQLQGVNLNAKHLARARLDLMHGVLSLWLQLEVRQLTLCLQCTRRRLT